MELVIPDKPCNVFDYFTQIVFWMHFCKKERCGFSTEIAYEAVKNQNVLILLLVVALISNKG